MDKIKVKFWKKPIYFDLLWNLENEIASMEKFQETTRQTQRIVFNLVIVVAVISFIMVCLQEPNVPINPKPPKPKKQPSLWSFFQQEEEEKEISRKQEPQVSPPWFLLPIICGFLVSQYVTWYYDEILRTNENKLITLKEKKKGMLENLMETETYDVIKDILERFGKDLKELCPPASQIQKATPLLDTSISKDDSVLRQRNKEVGSESGASCDDAPQTPDAPPAPESESYISTVNSTPSSNQFIPTSNDEPTKNRDNCGRLVSSKNPFDYEYQNPFADDDEELDKIESIKGDYDCETAQVKC